MSYESIKSKYIQLLEQQRAILTESEKRVVADDPDPLLVNNVNYFVKSYLVNICTYLESFLKEMAVCYCEEVADRVKSARIPKNFISWHIKGELKKNELVYDYLELITDNNLISDELSGNPHKTINLYRYLGLDLLANNRFIDCKDVVYTHVVKRNNIIHHNDEAGDLSFSDLRYFIDIVIEYVGAVFDVTTSESNSV